MTDKPKYIVRMHEDGHGSWEVIHKGSRIAMVEEVHSGSSKPNFVSRLFGKKPIEKTGYAITELPGASKEHFLTHAAATQYAVNYHHAGNHLRTIHPIANIKKHMKRLRQAIWASASDPRITNEDQEKILDLAQHHAQFEKKIKNHYPEQG